jgi:hypothetical protein
MNSAEEDWEPIDDDFEALSDGDSEIPHRRESEPEMPELAAAVAQMLEAIDEISAALANGERECQQAAALTRAAEAFLLTDHE